MRRRSRMGSHSADDLPSNQISPEVGCTRPFTAFKRVVLPEPLRPSSTTVSPSPDAQTDIAQDRPPADGV